MTGIRLDVGVVSLYPAIRSVPAVNFDIGKILSGSYLDKSVFSSTFPSNEFDTSMPVANVIINGSYVEGNIVTVNYLDTDGAVVSPPVAISVPVGEEYSIASPSVVGCYLVSVSMTYGTAMQP